VVLATKGPVSPREAIYNLTLRRHGPQTFSDSNLARVTFTWLSYLTDDPSTPERAAVSGPAAAASVRHRRGFDAGRTLRAAVRAHAFLGGRPRPPIRTSVSVPDGSIQVTSAIRWRATYPRNLF